MLPTSISKACEEAVLSIVDSEQIFSKSWSTFVMIIMNCIILTFVSSNLNLFFLSYSVSYWRSYCRHLLIFPILVAFAKLIDFCCERIHAVLIFWKFLHASDSVYPLSPQFIVLRIWCPAVSCNFRQIRRVQLSQLRFSTWDFPPSCSSFHVYHRQLLSNISI